MAPLSQVYDAIGLYMHIYYTLFSFSFMLMVSIYLFSAFLSHLIGVPLVYGGPNQIKRTTPVTMCWGTKSSEAFKEWAGDRVIYCLAHFLLLLVCVQGGPVYPTCTAFFRLSNY